MPSVTKRQAESVLRAVRKQFAPWILDGDRGPILRRGSFGSEIVWEDGPYEWAMKDPGGDIDEEFGFRIPARRPITGVHAEPINSFTLSLYPA